MSGLQGRGSVQASQRQATSQLQQVLGQIKLHKRPRVLTALFLWVFGLYVVFLSPAPVKLTEEKQRRFEHKLDILAKTEKPRQYAEQRWLEKEYTVSRNKEWFWRFKKDARKRVHAAQAEAETARQEYKKLEKEAQKKYSDAKAELGLFSEAGLDEGRRLFWRAFENGKVFGRRQTFWDGLIMILSSREEGLAGMLIQLIIQAIINFTTGMFASVVIFIFQLPSLLWSYQPSLLGGLAFFVIAVVGAVSVLASFLLALYAAGAAAVYSIATINPNQRVGFGAARRRRNIRYHVD